MKRFSYESRRQAVREHWKAFLVFGAITAVVAIVALFSLRVSSEKCFVVDEDQYLIYRESRAGLFFRKSSYKLATGPTEVAVKKDDSKTIHMDAVKIDRFDLRLPFRVRVVQNLGQKLADGDGRIAKFAQKFTEVKPVLFEGEIRIPELSKSAVQQLFAEAEDPRIGEPLIDRLRVALEDGHEEDDLGALSESITSVFSELVAKEYGIADAEVTVSDRRQIDTDEEEYDGRIASFVSVPTSPSTKTTKYYWNTFFKVFPLALGITLILLLVAFTCPELFLILGWWSM